MKLEENRKRLHDQWESAVIDAQTDPLIHPSGSAYTASYAVTMLYRAGKDL